MKVIKKIIATIVLVLMILMCFSGWNFSTVEAHTYTGKTAEIHLNKSLKIGVEGDQFFYTYKKNDEPNLNVYCAQRGGKQYSSSKYEYQEAYWKEDDEIFKDLDSFKKISWIKNNFWEKNGSNGYTIDEKVKILKLADSSITKQMVEDVFNSNKKYTVYQCISWTYVKNLKGFENRQDYLDKNARKIYDAIIKLADANYNKTDAGKVEVKNEGEVVPSEQNGVYTWKVKINNTCILPYELKVTVDGTDWNGKYTYENGIFTFKEVTEAGEHNFSVEATSYVVSSSASIWVNTRLQTMMEITSTNRAEKTDSVSSASGRSGYFTLNIKKVNADDQPVSGIKFNVNNVECTSRNDGIAEVISETNKVEITGKNQKFEYTVTEVKEETQDVVQLKDELKFTLISDVKKSGNDLIYYIRYARFDNGSNTKEVELINGKKVTVVLETKVDSDTTSITLKVPNGKKIYDLALTKSIMIKTEHLLEKYDFNFDGQVNASDTSVAYSLYDSILNLNPVTEDAIINLVINQGSLDDCLDNYRALKEEGKILDKFDLNEDGKIDVYDRIVASKILSLSASMGASGYADRVNSFSEPKERTTGTYNMDKTIFNVKKNEIIGYAITVYNEGEYDAKDIEVTDYLPEELEVCDENGNTTPNENGEIVCKNNTVWKVNGKTATTTITDTIPKLNGTKMSSKNVYITCKLKENTEENKVIYNISEITKSTPVDSAGNEVVGLTDRDSEENNLKGTKTEQQAINQYEKDFNEKTRGKNTTSLNKDLEYNYQDDDDFERIQIKSKILDLALRKSITKVGNDINNMVETEGRLPKIDSTTVSYCKSTGTGRYEHEKEAINVTINDYVEYTIRIYNEGSNDDYSGYAKQITDYLPEGLEFYGIVNKDGKIISTPTNSKYVTEKNNFGGYEVTYDESNNKVVIDCIDTPAVATKNYLEKLQILYEKIEEEQSSEEKIDNPMVIEGYYTSGELNSQYGYQEVKIICKVTNKVRSAYITNVAEITNSVAVENGEVVPGVKDKDSEYNNISITNAQSNLANKQINLTTYYEENEVDDVYNDYYPGLEDDDDFETVMITEFPYVFILNKVDENGVGLDGSRFTINKDNETILNNEEINKTKTIEEKVEKNKNCNYTITENESKNGYINILKDNKIHISTYLNDNAELVLGACGMQPADMDTTTKNKYYEKYGYYIEDKDGNLLEEDKTNLYNKIIVKADNTVYPHQIEVTVTNKIIEGQYDVELIKVDKKDGKTPLPGVKFDITVKKDGKETKLYDIKGNEIALKGLVTNEKGIISLPTIKITEEAAYTYEIEETEVPKGYVKLDNSIHLSLKTTIEDSKYVIANQKVSGPATMDATKNKITITVKNGQFDLALRKFITGVTDGFEEKHEVTERIPVFKVDEEGNYVYEHTKEPVLVANQNVVEYTLRVYNEGTIDGYAKELKDDIPEGLIFLPDDSLNKEYRWIMLDEEENETDDVNKAKYIVTDYLSKENEKEDGEYLLKAFDSEAYEAGAIKEPDYKEVKVAFKVTMPNTSEEIIINKAQISDDSDSDGNDVTDKDSTPNKWVEGEDDQDIEKIRVLCFDLSLRKWVTKAIVTENGKTVIHQTGHKAEDNPEAVVKVDLKKSKIKNVEVKFEYQIRVKNDREIDGYVQEITDYIPEGLKFVPEDNPDWKDAGDGKVTTDKLKDTLLKHGETAEVTIILTWINGESNMGLKVNVAEISKDYNEYGSPDIDSTPNNQVPGEDDIDDAPVMLTVTTGQTILYVGLASMFLGIVLSGVILIKKYVI